MAADPLIEADQLDSISNLRFVDVREETEFQKGSLPDAVRAPVADWVAAAKSDDSSFDNTAFWEHEIRKLGIGADTTAVIFDDGRMTEASRVWFILQYFGAKAIILNGGWPEVTASADLAGSIVRPSSEKPSSADGQPFVARPASGPVGLIDRNLLKEKLGETAPREVAVFDTRTAPEHHGDDLKNNARGGHLPEARLLPHADLLDGTRLKDRDTLHDLIAAAGFQRGDYIVTHCDGGARAALAAVATLHAGFDNVSVYYLSFADWAKDDSCPIV